MAAVTAEKSSSTIDKKAAYDAACKRVLSEKTILAWIMKSCLEEYYNCSTEEIAKEYIEGQPQIGKVPVAPQEDGTVIQGMDTSDKSLTEGNITYDIRFYALLPDSKERIRLIINIEAQLKFYPGYPLTKRGIYYCSRMISSQYGREFTKSHYESIKKVYSVWICMSPPDSRKNTITRYRMAEENLVGHVREDVQNYDLLSVVMVCLGGPDDPNYGGVLKLLDTLFTTRTSMDEKRKSLKDEFQIEMTQHLESEVSSMCNWSDGIEERGIEKGRETTIIKALGNLMKNLGLTLESAMEALDIPEAERDTYAKLLKNPGSL